MTNNFVGYYRLGMRFVTHNNGTAMPEYAVLIAVIGLAVLGFSFQASRHLNGVFHRTANTFIGNSTESIVSRQSDQAKSVSDVQDAERERFVYNVAMIAVLILAVGSWIIERRARVARPSHDESSHSAALHFQDASAELSPSRFAQKRLQILALLVNNNHKLLPSDLKVCDLMTTGVKTALPSTPVSELRVTLTENSFRHILICNAERELVGIVSDRDLRNVSDNMPAEAIMAQCPTTVASESLVNNAITLLLYGHISSLPVVDSGRLVGILTTTDVVMTLQCSMLAVEQMVRNLAADRRPCRLEPLSI